MCSVAWFSNLYTSEQLDLDLIPNQFSSMLKGKRNTAKWKTLMEQRNAVLWSAAHNRGLLVTEVKWNWDVKQNWNYIVWGDSCSIFRGICKKERSSILIGNIIICNTNLHLGLSRKLPFYAALAYSIMSYDFMKSQVVEMNEAKQPCAWFSV